MFSIFIETERARACESSIRVESGFGSSLVGTGARNLVKYVSIPESALLLATHSTRHGRRLFIMFTGHLLIAVSVCLTGTAMFRR